MSVMAHIDTDQAPASKPIVCSETAASDHRQAFTVDRKSRPWKKSCHEKAALGRALPENSGFVPKLRRARALKRQFPVSASTCATTAICWRTGKGPSSSTLTPRGPPQPQRQAKSSPRGSRQDSRQTACSSRFAVTLGGWSGPSRSRPGPNRREAHATSGGLAFGWLLGASLDCPLRHEPPFLHTGRHIEKIHLQPSDPVDEHLAELEHLLPNDLMAKHDGACRQHPLDHAQAEWKMEAQPHRLADHLGQEAMASIGAWRLAGSFRPSTGPGSPRQVPLDLTVRVLRDLLLRLCLPHHWEWRWTGSGEQG